MRGYLPSCGAVALALTLCVLVLSGCGAGLTAAQVVQRSSENLARDPAYRLSGYSQNSAVRVTFKLLVAGKDFSGQVDTKVQGSPALVTRIIALGDKVWVQSPSELQQLGISALPGKLNPKTTWVLESDLVAASYRQSLSPFVGQGLVATLDHQAQERLTMARQRLSGRPVYLVEDSSGGQQLRVYVSRTGLQLLRLDVSGDHQVSLVYAPLDGSARVSPPPAGHIYAPPSAAPSG